MNVSDHRDRRLYVYDIALFHQQLFRLGAYCFDYGVSEELLPVQASDAFVEIYAGLRGYQHTMHNVWLAGGI